MIQPTESATLIALSLHPGSQPMLEIVEAKSKL